MDGDNIVDAEKEFEIAALRGQLENLTHEIIKYKILLNEIDSEANPDIVTDAEAICVEQIRRLKEDSSKRVLSSDEAKKLDIFHKNLKLSRGEGSRVGSRTSAGKMTSDQLAEIAKE